MALALDKHSKGFLAGAALAALGVIFSHRLWGAIGFSLLGVAFAFKFYEGVRNSRRAAAAARGIFEKPESIMDRNTAGRAEIAVFQIAQAQLLWALNGVDGYKADEAEIVELRRAVLRAQAACKEAGCEVETLWEVTQRKSAERQEKIRHHFAELKEELKEPRINLTRRDRHWLSCVISLIPGLLILVGGWPSIGGAIGGAFCSLIIFEPIDFLLAKRFPTLGVRVAQFAWSLGESTVLRDMFPPDSDDYKDYQFIYRMKVKTSGRPISRGWIKVR
ncbi:MAG TPA: hypothetical protein VFK06_24625 [Candidatus Angelobacter sp.]|nr:hypothetical protein [Candidatus Angelobacter sp.]